MAAGILLVLLIATLMNGVFLLQQVDQQVDQQADQQRKADQLSPHSKEQVSTSQHSPTPDKGPCNNENNIGFEYVRVCTQTADEFLAGTGGDIAIQFIGSWCMSLDYNLDTENKNDFERGNKDCFDLTIPDVGDLNEIQMSNDKKESKYVSGNIWKLDNVTVRYKNNLIRFDFHTEIGKNDLFYSIFLL
ncbi:hypothetical protein V1264_016963 [Littorina saxatilis]|uniref:PLAT domain-containing protein n=1 Tax=Littorina saxatilis TaxID=31220 RepID=A0AAN9GF94_9CAEN